MMFHDLKPGLNCPIYRQFNKLEASFLGGSAGLNLFMEDQVVSVFVNQLGHFEHIMSFYSLYSLGGERASCIYSM